MTFSFLIIFGSGSWHMDTVGGWVKFTPFPLKLTIQIEYP